MEGWVAIGDPVCYNRASKSTKETRLTSATLPLATTIEDQDTLLEYAFAILDEGIKQRAFPGASVAITSQGALVAHKGFGHYTYDKKARAVEAESIFDIASLTKVVATTTMAMLLHERGILDLDSFIIGTLPEFAVADDRRDQVTFRMLLAHNSGLPAWLPLFELGSRERAYTAALECAFAYPTGTHVVYSDIGLILLGLAPSLLPAMVIFFLMGVANVVFVVPNITLSQEVTPPELRARVFGARIALLNLSWLPIILVSGALADRVDAGILIGVAGAVTLATAVFAARFLPAVSEVA